jgi:hypothetical protein
MCDGAARGTSVIVLVTRQRGGVMFEMNSGTVLRQAKAQDLAKLVRESEPRVRRTRRVRLAPARAFRVLAHPFASRVATPRTAH